MRLELDFCCFLRLNYCNIYTLWQNPQKTSSNVSDISIPQRGNRLCLSGTIKSIALAEVKYYCKRTNYNIELDVSALDIEYSIRRYSILKLNFHRHARGNRFSMGFWDYLVISCKWLLPMLTFSIFSYVWI